MADLVSAAELRPGDVIDLSASQLEWFDIWAAEATDPHISADDIPKLQRRSSIVPEMLWNAGITLRLTVMSDPHSALLAAHSEHLTFRRDQGNSALPEVLLARLALKDHLMGFDVHITEQPPKLASPQRANAASKWPRYATAKLWYGPDMRRFLTSEKATTDGPEAVPQTARLLGFMAVRDQTSVGYGLAVKRPL